MILYRKGTPVRIRRTLAPEPPFWAATTIAPYSGRRAAPIAIDYLTMRASGTDRADAVVSENIRDELERIRPVAEPVLIDASESVEAIFRRGEEVLGFCEDQGRSAIHLISTRGVVPVRQYRDVVVVISAWPPELSRLETMFTESNARGMQWGVTVPVMFPATTDLEMLKALAVMAHGHGAAFLAAAGVRAEPTARQAIAHSMDLSPDDDRYAMLFHGSMEPLLLATERHVAALAWDGGMADFVVPPRWSERTNWNAATLLTLTASRMMAMESDLDLAAAILRSARAIAELEKPLTRIAESASIGIVSALDETSVEIVTEWLDGASPGYVEFVNAQWRMRRDSGA